MGRLLVSADLTSDRTSATGGCPRFALLGCKVHPSSAASIVASPLHGDLLVSADLTADEISATGGHRRFVPACCGCYMTCRASNFPQLQQGRREPFPGRPASLAGLCAKRTAKARQTDRKMNSFIFRLASWLSFARKLAWRASSYRRMPFVSFFKLVRRNGSRGPYPAAACGGCRREKAQ